MTPDYYATLGLSPTSEDVVIRAAYLALIRRYHPDGNTSAAAAARTRAINAAYAVLSDPVQRAEYDQMRSAEAWPNAPLRRSMLPAPSRLFAAASVTVLLVLVFLVIWSPLPLLEPPDRMRQVQDQRPPTPKSDPVPPAADEPATRPNATDEQAVEDPQLDQPLPELSPPPLTPAPRQPALSRPPPSPVPPAAAPKARVALQPKASRPTASKPAASKPAPPQQAESKPVPPQPQPSFNCRIARTRGEIAVCGNGNLANLDRQQALLYGQSLVLADAAKRTQLLSTRDRFITRRDACRSVSCARAAYLARMREVSEIMTGPAKQPQ